jgi:hypothetical protein
LSNSGEEILPQGLVEIAGGLSVRIERTAWVSCCWGVLWSRGWSTRRGILNRLFDREILTLKGRVRRGGGGVLDRGLSREVLVGVRDDQTSEVLVRMEENGETTGGCEPRGEVPVHISRIRATILNSTQQDSARGEVRWGDVSSMTRSLWMTSDDDSIPSHRGRTSVWRREELIPRRIRTSQALKSGEKSVGDWVRGMDPPDRGRFTSMDDGGMQLIDACRDIDIRIVFNIATQAIHLQDRVTGAEIGQGDHVKMQEADGGEKSFNRLVRIPPSSREINDADWISWLLLAWWVGQGRSIPNILLILRTIIFKSWLWTIIHRRGKNLYPCCRDERGEREPEEETKVHMTRVVVW